MARSVVIAMALLVAATSRAEMPGALSVAGDGACPTAAALAHALERLHPTLRATVDGDGEVRVEVADRGRSYEVRVGGRARRLEDAARRCGERATAAALAVTLLVDPPTGPPTAPPPEEPEGPMAPRATPVDSAPSPEEPRPVAPATPRPVVTPRPALVPPPGPAAIAPSPATVTRPAPSPSARRPWRVDLEATGLVDGAPAVGSAASEVTGGAALRLAVGGRYLAGTLGISGLAPASATSASVGVTVVRIPFDAGLRLQLPLGRVTLGADVGLALAILQLSAPALDGATTNTRLDVGARLAPFLRIGLWGRWSLVLGMQMVVSFAPYDLVVQPSTVPIATTPRLWLGGGLGLSVRL